MRKSWHEYFFDLAHSVAERSTCPRLHVGAVIVSNDNRILATGYNGAPSRYDQCDQLGCRMEGNSCTRTIHAEANALLELSRFERKGARMYITDYPCRQCALLIANSGLAEIYYDRPYARADLSVLVDFIVLSREEFLVFNDRVCSDHLNQ